MEIKPVEATVEAVKPDIVKRPISMVFRPDQLTKNSFTIRRSAALGDSLAATCVAKKLGEMGHPVIFQSNEASHCILSRVPWIKKPQEVNGTVHIDLDGAYEKHPKRTELHFYDIYIECANEQLKNWDIVLPKSNLSPRMIVTDRDRELALQVMSKFPKPWTIICPRSNHWLNRMVPNLIWEQAAKTVVGTKFWLARDAAPSGIIDLKCRQFDNAIRYIACADLLVTVDTGPMHVAAALGVPLVAIEQSSSPRLHLSDQQDWISIAPNLDCLNCQKEKCPLDAEHPPCQNVPSDLIARTVNDRLGVTRDGISAVICIYRPTTGNLQRCINAVLPQVNEVIVVGQHNSIVPDGAPRGDKIRYVTRPGTAISYGRNANYGVRHCKNKYIWLLNDDFFAELDVVQKLKSSMDDKTAVVGHLLRYPDGLIQHGGKSRQPGAVGWGHVDHKARESRIKTVVDMENVCLASALVSRKAFYDIGGFSESYRLYAEDDDFCIHARFNGWKVKYNPHACGIHIDHASTRNIIGVNDIVKESNEILERTWGWWVKDQKPIF